jgi:hypothetical protein
VKAKHLILIILSAFIGSYGIRMFVENAFSSTGESSDELVSKLRSEDPVTVVQGFNRLTREADPVAVPQALQLLESPDESVWLNAALYLGTCHRKEAVPYLIKALRHTSSRSDAVAASHLKAMTSQNFGPDFESWKSWWRGQPGSRSDFNWGSRLGFSPRIKGSSRVP